MPATPLYRYSCRLACHCITHNPLTKGDLDGDITSPPAGDEWRSKRHSRRPRRSQTERESGYSCTSMATAVPVQLYDTADSEKSESHVDRTEFGSM